MVKDKQELCVLFSVALFLPLLQTAQKVDLDTCTMCVRAFVCVSLHHTHMFNEELSQPLWLCQTLLQLSQEVAT